MNITVLGATGKTGVPLVDQALERGHQVTALVREPARLPIQHSSLKVVPGDILDPQAVEKAVAGAEAVLGVLGPTSNEPVFAISNGMKNILVAMEKHGVRRLIQSVGAGLPDPKDQPRLVNNVSIG